MITEEQRKQRLNGIGASDTPIIMGYSTFKSPYELYLEKIGQLEPDDEETELQYWGNAIEPLILQRFSELNDNVVIEKPDTIYHPEHKFIFANLDGYIPSMNAVVEAKMANSFQRKKWDSALEDGIPLIYLIQIAKQVAVTNADRGFCAVLIGGNEFKQFTYERDKELEGLILEADIGFWECVQKRIEPDPININDCRLKFNQPDPDAVQVLNFPTGQALAKLIDVQAQIKLMEEKLDFHKMEVMSHLGNAEYLSDLDGNIVATWKANKKGTRVFNIKRI